MNTILSLLLACAPFAQGAEDEILRLRNGRVMVAEILEHDLDGLSVRSIRDGGRFDLVWGDLFPGEADRLRTGFGYDLDERVPEVSADKLLLVNGEEIVGRIVSRDDRNIAVRVRDTTATIPLARLAAPPERVTVEAPQVLTPEQFYNERVTAVDAEDALRQYEFALELQTVFALEQAKAHFEFAGELASANGDDALLRRVEGSLSRLAVTLENRAQAQALDHIKQLMHRERFAQAKEELDTFGRDHGDSALRADYLDLADRFEERRESAMVRYLNRNWYDKTIAVLRKRAIERDANVDSLISWVESQVPEIIRAEMAEGLRIMKADLDPSEVDALWMQRKNYSARRHQASFGNGTWVLGEDKARAGLVAAEEEVDDGKTPEQRELEARTKKYLENLERARRSASGSNDDKTPEDWWRRAKGTERFQFLLAYYAEFSGDFEITHVSFSNCASCAGSGVLKILDLGNSGGQTRNEKCPTCQRVGVKRTITFR